MSLGLWLFGWPISVSPAEANPQSSQLSLHLESPVGQEVRQLGRFCASSSSLSLSFEYFVFEPVFIPREKRRQGDAEDRMRRHDEFREERKLFVRRRVDEQESRVQRGRNQVNRNPNVKVVVIQLNQREEDEEQRHPQTPHFR